MGEIYQNTDYKGNFIDNARVRQNPTGDQSIVNKGHLTDMFIEQGLDGFVEATFKIVDIIIKNDTIKDKVIYNNRPWKVYCIVETNNNSRLSHTISGYLRFGEYDIDFNCGPYTPSQSESIYGITLKENQLLYVFDSMLYDGDKSRLILSDLISITFIATFPEVVVNYKGHEVIHTAVTLSESSNKQEFVNDYDYYPILLDFSSYITSIAGQTITTPYIPNTGIDTNISDEFYILPLTNKTNSKILTFIPQTTSKRYYVVLLDENDNPLSDRIYISQDAVNYDFVWLGIEYSQSLITLGYIPEAQKVLIAFDK